MKGGIKICSFPYDVQKKEVVPAGDIVRVCPLCNKVKKYGKFETLTEEETQVLKEKGGAYHIEKELCPDCSHQ